MESNLQIHVKLEHQYQHRAALATIMSVLMSNFKASGQDAIIEPWLDFEGCTAYLSQDGNASAVITALDGIDSYGITTMLRDISCDCQQCKTQSGVQA
ncbi:hypothetical protein QTI05_24260 [Variovorax sp. J22R193]|uniref:hypothetical protein n=1 Tax=Variovorax fucosicus TaxID=3053517 RepID=UPI0025759974|nr:hypothetical protein [Variovorax sp. J22R193]MDM0042174.1 hypothetical protein [Variovorax sp. J22R193]